MKEEGHRAPPQYRVCMWNCHERAMNGGARTNNSVEDWDCSIQNVLGCVHSTIRKLVNALTKEKFCVIDLY